MTFLRRLWGLGIPSDDPLARRRMPRGWFMVLVIIGGWTLVGLAVWLIVLLLGG